MADAERLKADKLNIETVEVQVTDAETLEKVVSKADAILR